MPVAASRRIISVDILRGITIAGMILVNNPGTWDHIYWPLEHAEWNGYTPTDFVFPFFLFLVGMVIPFSLDSDKLQGKKPYRKILSRSLKLILLGIFLGAWRIHFPFIETWPKLRIPGVLQRIGVVYCIVSILYLNVNWKRLLAVGLLCLLGYFAFMTMVPLPDGSLPTLARNSNWESVIDLRIFGTHMWEPDYDPEGLLSTIPAIATAIFGVLIYAPSSLCRSYTIIKNQMAADRRNYCSDSRIAVEFNFSNQQKIVDQQLCIVHRRMGLPVPGGHHVHY